LGALTWSIMNDVLLTLRASGKKETFGTISAGNSW
jgi:hypothetical protein